MGASRAWRLRFWLVLWVGFWVLVLGEVGSRLRMRWQVPYYAVMQAESGVVHYPFGDVYVDAATGLPDEVPSQRDLKPRALYLGDSTTYGIGAGSEHRFTETLDALVPGWHHINAGKPGWGGPDHEGAPALFDRVRQLKAARIFYVLNLNDIAPVDGQAAVWGMGSGSYLLSNVASVYHWARDRYAPTSRPRTVELYPHENVDAFLQACQRINRFAGTLLEQDGKRLTVVVLPYEMQISSEAADAYAAAGITWEEGFLGGSAQRVLMDCLEDVEAHDARAAFPNDRSVPVGRSFVHTAGGRLDFDHLTRDGHARVGHWMARVLFDPALMAE